MPSLLRYSSYRGRRLRVDEALLEKFAMSRVGYWFLLKVAPWIDRAVIPRTGGRLSSMGVNKIGLLVTIGAKSGQRRTQPIVLIPSDGGLIAIGSNYGRPKHPSWTANLLAHPDCDVTFRGAPRAYRAALLSDPDRRAAWDTAVDFYAGYARYEQKCAPREIRLFRLTPA
jgi:deazaflavin-dependent oxidoreductase (nitroreductase family)